MAPPLPDPSRPARGGGYRGGLLPFPMKESVFKTKPVARIGGRLIDHAEWKSIKRKKSALRRATRMRRIECPELINYLKKVRQNDREKDCMC